MRSIAYLLPLVALALQAPLAPARADAGDSHTLTVTGVAEVRARPDRALIQLGVQTRADTAQAAMAQNNVVMNKIIDALKTLGVPDQSRDETVQTSYISLSPIYTQPPQTDPRLPPPPPVLAGFEASNVVALDLVVEPNGASKVGPALDAATAAGANQIQGISFRLANEQQAKLQALQQAGAQARAKADALAMGLGIAIGAVDAASEVSYQVTPVDRAVAPAPADGGTSTPVLPGELIVQAQVQVRFTLK
jgi:uncharacterized protein